MNNLLHFKEFKENIDKIITLYHGQKGYRGEKFKEFDFKIFPYFYLSPDYDYCFNYAVGREAIHTFKVDTSNFVDLTSLHYTRTMKEFLEKFLKITGTYFPAELQKKDGPFTFWEIIRRDSRGYITRRLLSKGINGFKMIETLINDLDLHTVYVLLNNDPIIKEI